MEEDSEERVRYITRCVRQFVGPGKLTELRILTPAGEIFAGWYTCEQLPQLAAAALEYETKAKGLYFIPNPIAPHDKPMAMSRRGAGLTTDEMIESRRWLLIDVDPVRRGIDGDVLADQACPSTDAEREAAWQVVMRCKHGVEAFGLTGGVVGDSGNGFHLCYPVSLANDDNGKALHKFLLQELEARCGDKDAHVDLKTFNASRIWKLYGTHARKGVESEERTWRQSQIAMFPQERGNPAENAVNLQRLVSAWTTQNRHRQQSQGNSPDPTSYARKALEGELGRMLSATPGNLNNTLFACAAALGNFVGSGLLARGEVEQKLATAVLAVGGKDEAKNLATIRRGIEEGEKTPRTAPEKTKQQIATATPEVIATKPSDVGISCAELMKLDIPEPRFAVPGLLPEGVVILAARPKVGKSWLALGIGLAVAQGANVCGTTPIQGLPTEKGDVLYLALEDTRRRLKKRVGKILESTQWVAPPNMEFRVASERADKGGLLHIGSWLESHPEARLVIVDTLAKFRAANKGGNKNDAYSEDYEAICGMKTLADRHAVCVMVIHHSRKAFADSPFDEVSGTLGLTGAADAIFVIQRTHGQTDAQLYTTGRDIEEETITINWDAPRCLWSIKNREQGVNRPEQTNSEGGGKAKETAPRLVACSMWVTQRLSQNPCRQSALIAEAEADGFDKKLLWRAFDALNCVKFDDERQYKWVRLPEKKST